MLSYLSYYLRDVKSSFIQLSIFFNIKSMTVSKCVIDLAMRVLPTEPIDHGETISYAYTAWNAFWLMHDTVQWPRVHRLVVFFYPCISMIAMHMQEEITLMYYI